jgi:ribosome-binding factor A
MNRRIDRVNELLRQEISQLLSRQIKDPRLTGVISITQVRTTHDLRSALVSLSVMGDAAAKRDALEGIQSAATFIRKELKDRVALRYVPFLSFEVDNSLEEADKLLQIMNQLRNDEGSQTAMEQGAESS